MSLTGKGYYIWKIPQCENGNVAAIASVAKAAGLTHLLIKVANGIYAYNYDFTRNVDLVPPLVQALKAQGIEAWGWHYVFGNDPQGEARIAVKRARDLDLDGFVVNAEVEYKQPGKKSAADRYMRDLRAGLPNTPIGLSSFRFPSYHPQLPWKEFLERCDYNMPQVYWMQANNPGAQLARCIREFQGMAPFREIFPTGAAFSEHGWTPKPEEITAFLQTAQTKNLNGANFWSWDSSRPRLPQLWDAVAGYPWSGTPPALDIAQQYVNALNTRNPDQMLAIYQANPVHVNAARTIQGLPALRAWYVTLFNQLLPSGTFTLTGYSGVGSSRHLTWTAVSSAGRVTNGNDALGLADGKIGYHYTFFTITP
jgi:hypothetical protein